MAVIKSGASTDVLTIDPTSKAARVSLYSSDGTYNGEKASYRGASASVLAAVGSTAPFFAIQGSSTKTVRIQRISISGLSLTAVAYVQINLAKYSSAISGGTSTDLTMTPLDSNDAAGTLSVIKTYTAAPTPGSKVGDIASRRYLAQAATAAAGGIPDEITFDFRLVNETSPIVLRGTAQGVALYFTSAPASAVSMSIEVEWTEE